MSPRRFSACWHQQLGDLVLQVCQRLLIPGSPIIDFLITFCVWSR